MRMQRQMQDSDPTGDGDAQQALISRPQTTTLSADCRQRSETDRRTERYESGDGAAAGDVRAKRHVSVWWVTDCRFPDRFLLRRLSGRTASASQAAGGDDLCSCCSSSHSAHMHSPLSLWYFEPLSRSRRPGSASLSFQRLGDCGERAVLTLLPLEYTGTHIHQIVSVRDLISSSRFIVLIRAVSYDDQTQV